MLLEKPKPRPGFTEAVTATLSSKASNLTKHDFPLNSAMGTSLQQHTLPPSLPSSFEKQQSLPSFGHSQAGSPEVVLA